MDLGTVLRVIFVVGIVALPILYWLSSKGVVKRSQGRVRNENMSTQSTNEKAGRSTSLAAEVERDRTLGTRR